MGRKKSKSGGCAPQKSDRFANSNMADRAGVGAGRVDACRVRRAERAIVALGLAVDGHEKGVGRAVEAQHILQPPIEGDGQEGRG